MRWKRPILSTTQASCWGTNRTTVFMGRLEAHRCWAGASRRLWLVSWVFCWMGRHDIYYKRFLIERFSSNLAMGKMLAKGDNTSGGKCKELTRFYSVHWIITHTVLYRPISDPKAVLLCCSRTSEAEVAQSTENHKQVETHHFLI